MKKVLAGLSLILFLSGATLFPLIAFQNTTNILGASLDFNSISGTQGFNIAGRNLSYHIFTWAKQRGNVSACTFTLQTSPEGTTWTDYDSTTYSCTSGGASDLLNFAANWVRFKPSVLTYTGAAPLITVNYRGIVDTFSIPSNQAQVYDIRSYGGNCTGSANNATAITAADTLAIASNGYIYFPPTNGGCHTNTVTILSKIAPGSGLLYVNTGQTLTLNTPPTYLGRIKLFLNASYSQGTVAFLSSGTFYPEWLGAKSDGSSGVSGLALARLCDLLPTGSKINLDAGTYTIGSLDRTACLITQSNIEISGAGIGITILTYNSNYTGIAGDWTFPNHGSPLTVYGDAAGGHAARNIYLHDFTLSDLGTVDWDFIGHNPSCLDIISATQLKISHIETKNCKGNGAMYLLGYDENNVPSSVNGRDIEVSDNIVYHPQFTGINWGGWDKATIRGNDITVSSSAGGIGTAGGVHRIGLDISYNTVKFEGTSTGSCIFTGAAAAATITYNKCLNLDGDNGANLAGIVLGSEDAPTTHIIFEGFIISGNYIQQKPGSGGSVPCIYLFGAFGGIMDGFKNVMISNNHLSCRQAVSSLGYETDALYIDNNTIDNTAANVLFNHGGAVLNPTVLYMRNNAFNSTGSALQLVSDASNNFLDSSAHFKLYGNTLGSTLSQSQTSTLGAHAAVGSLPNVNPGVISTEQTLTLTGAAIGDKVRVYLDTPAPVGIHVEAYVKVADTIGYWVSNQSGSVYGGATVARFFIDDRH